ncbi:hypothetical protein [Methyloceanibacter sp.]|uniref:hypothetical protein n=1 Tax=Methyloceanibacter sp. TaxID=1965321 RepID=UPI002C3593DA|nr:hypothetical protein [Methyloceanibacter sp.]HML91833.1 hypothetical protein [Methyloceanibacter sp.]
MTLSTLSRPVGSPFASLGGHAVHRTTALLQKALHASRRAALGREYGEERGIHRLSSPSTPDAPLGGGTAEGTAPPANFAFFRAYLLGRPQRRITVTPAASDDTPLDAEADGIAPSYAAQSQLRGLIHDFKERQQHDGRVVARSIAAAIALTVIGLALLVATATAGRTGAGHSAAGAAPQTHEIATPRSGA